MGSGVGDTELKRAAKLRACRNQVGLPHRSNHSWPSNGCSGPRIRGHECHRNRMSPAVTVIYLRPGIRGPRGWPLEHLPHWQRFDTLFDKPKKPG